MADKEVSKNAERDKIVKDKGYSTKASSLITTRRTNRFPVNVLQQSELKIRLLRSGVPLAAAHGKEINQEEIDKQFKPYLLPRDRKGNHVAVNLVNLDTRKFKRFFSMDRNLQRGTTYQSGGSEFKRRASLVRDALVMMKGGAKRSGAGSPLAGIAKLLGTKKDQSDADSDGSDEVSGKIEEVEEDSDGENEVAEYLAAVTDAVSDRGGKRGEELMKLFKTAVDHDTQTQDWQMVSVWHSAFESAKIAEIQALKKRLSQREKLQTETLQSISLMKHAGDLTLEEAHEQNKPQSIEEKPEKDRGKGRKSCVVSDDSLGLWEQAVERGKKGSLAYRKSFYLSVISHLKSDGGIANLAEEDTLLFLRNILGRGESVDSDLFFNLLGEVGPIRILDYGVMYIMHYIRQSCDVSLSEFIDWMVTKGWTFDRSEVELAAYHAVGLDGHSAPPGSPSNSLISREGPRPQAAHALMALKQGGSSSNLLGNTRGAGIPSYLMTKERARSLVPQLVGTGSGSPKQSPVAKKPVRIRDAPPSDPLPRYEPIKPESSSMVAILKGITKKPSRRNTLNPEESLRRKRFSATFLKPSRWVSMAGASERRLSREDIARRLSQGIDPKSHIGEFLMRSERSRDNNNSRRMSMW